MQPLKSPIGLLGGTFDPVHRGHIELATQLCDLFSLDSIRFIPCKIPLLKTGAQASAKERVEMLEIACRPYPKFVIDTQEIERETPSYMVETLQALRKTIPNTPLCLILGMDAFAELPGWHKWEKLVHLAHLIVINRAGIAYPDNANLKQLYQDHYSNNLDKLHHSLAGSLLILKLPPKNQASRLIRKAISQGENVAADLPEGVWEYIIDHKLYKDA